MKVLYIMELDFTQVAALAGYESVTIERIWNGISRMSLRIAADVRHADELIADRVIWFDREYDQAFVIEAVTRTLIDGAIMIDLEALHVNSLLRDYITVPPAGYATDAQTGTREQIVRAWVDNNAIDPTDASRQQYPIALGDYAGIGDSITASTRYKGLADEVSRILGAEHLGWVVRLDLEASEYVFEVLGGEDRTQTAVPENLLASRKDEDDADWATGTLTQVTAADNELLLDKDPARTHDGTWLAWDGLTWQEAIGWD